MSSIHFTRAEGASINRSLQSRETASRPPFLVRVPDFLVSLLSLLAGLPVRHRSPIIQNSWNCEHQVVEGEGHHGVTILGVCAAVLLRRPSPLWYCDFFALLLYPQCE